LILVVRTHFGSTHTGLRLRCYWIARTRTHCGCYLPLRSYTTLHVARLTRLGSHTTHAFYTVDLRCWFGYACPHPLPRSHPSLRFMDCGCYAGWLFYICYPYCLCRYAYCTLPFNTDSAATCRSLRAVCGWLPHTAHTRLDLTGSYVALRYAYRHCGGSAVVVYRFVYRPHAHYAVTVAFVLRCRLLRTFGSALHTFGWVTRRFIYTHFAAVATLPTHRIDGCYTYNCRAPSYIARLVLIMPVDYIPRQLPYAV